jgi:hypothetical protein
MKTKEKGEKSMKAVSHEKDFENREADYAEKTRMEKVDRLVKEIAK